MQEILTNDRADGLEPSDTGFNTLLKLARAGNEEAINSLWAEFEYDYYEDEIKGVLLDWFIEAYAGRAA